MMKIPQDLLISAITLRKLLMPEDPSAPLKARGKA